MSAIYSQLNKKSIEAAISKAKTVKPLVKVLGYNNFQVQGSSGQFYTVCFTGAGLDFTGDCTCKANQGNKVCYHVAAVAHIYKQQVATRAAERAAALVAIEKHDLWSEVCRDCQTEPATSKEGRCDGCQVKHDYDLLFN